MLSQCEDLHAADGGKPKRIRAPLPALHIVLKAIAVHS